MAIKLNTMVFELYKEKYSSLSQLARVMGMTTSHVSRVKTGKRGINQRFIIGAIKAFPGYDLADLFYITPKGVKSPKLPDFREYARQKYPDELDEDLITMIGDLIERQRGKHR